MGLRKDKGSQKKYHTYGENAKIPTKRAKKGATALSASNDQEIAPTTAPIVSNASSDQEITAAQMLPMTKKFQQSQMLPIFKKFQQSQMHSQAPQVSQKSRSYKTVPIG